ncbi:MAG: stage III sporulation protein AE [Clostridia bacterium]|nr:stage III sporulation protein AE [Clostridia bacterium]
MKRRVFAVLAAVFAALMLAVPAFAEEGDEDISDELERQTDALELDGWDEYYGLLAPLVDPSAASLRELVLKLSESGAGPGPEGLYGTALSLLKEEAKRVLASAAVLAAAALVTSLAGLVEDKGMKQLVSTLLLTASVSLTAGLFTGMARTAADSIGRVGELSERAAPVMSTLLVSLGAQSSAGLFRPLMVFLSETVIVVINRAELPLVLAGGVLAIADAVTDGGALSKAVRLISKASKWLLGLISVFYFGMTAVQGLTVAARDGVSIRTAKYAIDKLVPVVGGMVSGTVDSVMGCALLVKNGVGLALILILLAILFRPLLSLAAGAAVFRIAAAVSEPAADPRASKLFSNAAEMTEHLFACTAVTGTMLALTVLVFIASGGVTAGLW